MLGPKQSMYLHISIPGWFSLSCKHAVDFAADLITSPGCLTRMTNTVAREPECHQPVSRTFSPFHLKAPPSTQTLNEESRHFPEFLPLSPSHPVHQHSLLPSPPRRIPTVLTSLHLCAPFWSKPNDQDSYIPGAYIPHRPLTVLTRVRL